MARVCTMVTEWIETHVSKPIEDWVQHQEEKCKKRHWYDPRRWFCWLVTTLVEIIRWVVVTVVTAVITLVSHLISDLLSISWDLLKFLGHLLKALFTWDKCVLHEALADLFDSLVGLYELSGDVIIRPIIDRIQIYRLRRYVAHEILRRYWMQSDLIPVLKEKFNVDSGVFGYRVTCTVHRMYVDSTTKTPRFGDVPNLYALHCDGLINLYDLAGLNGGCVLISEKGWYHPRHQTGKYPCGSGGGLGAPTLTKDDLDEYINSAGAGGPHFLIWALSNGDLDTRCDVAEEWGRQLGLILSFSRQDLEIVDEQYFNYAAVAQTNLLKQVLGRHQGFMQLCSPVAVAVFGFADRIQRGLTNNLVGTDWCIFGRNLNASDTSGVSFIDDIPDSIRKYVLIHELGHYFGLCHVDGFDRIMVSGAPPPKPGLRGQGDLWTVWAAWALPNLFVHGGPRFIYTEAQHA
jgi:hypothetical protein